MLRLILVSALCPAAVGVGLKHEAFLAKQNKTVGGSDPHCAAGVLSLPGNGPQACCAGYCGECTDYPTCKSVRGQASENACCASSVLKLDCGGSEPEAMPPCIMAPGEEFSMPEQSSAAEDCNEAVPQW